MKSSLTASKLLCNLHSQPFSLYCDRCLEPVCQKCTFIGPHNTTIHSLIPLHQAYQRRVQQINKRLNNLSQTRQSAITKISLLTNQINTINLKSQQINIQNDKNRIQIQNRLQKHSQNIICLLQKQQQQIISHINQINDLGHQFQSLATTSDIDCLINYGRIMQELRQIIDKLQIIIDKNINIKQLPKQLSQLRIKLQQIQNYKQLYIKKIQIITKLITKLYEQIKKIQTPKIQYQDMLKQINKLLLRYQSNQQYSNNLQKPTLKKIHCVCYFCGIIMDDYTINTSCIMNKIGEQIKTTDKYSSYYTNTSSNAPVVKVGYCKKQPDIVFFGTQRHYFGQPSNPNIFFRASFLNLTLSKQVLSLLLTFLPDSDTALHQINQSTKSKNNSFTNYLQLLFLKIITLVKIKKQDLQKLFNKQDIGGNDNKIGYCQVIAMQYIFMEIIGLNNKQANILLDICNYVSMDLAEYVDKKDRLRNYEKMLQKLKNIKI